VGKVKEGKVIRPRTEGVYRRLPTREKSPRGSGDGRIPPPPTTPVTGVPRTWGGTVLFETEPRRAIQIAESIP